MSFFESELVANELKEIDRLQTKLVRMLPKLPSLDQDELVEYFDGMIELLEKQKLFYVRLQLSDSKEAVDAKQKLVEMAALLGGDPKIDPGSLYSSYLTRLHEMRDMAKKGILDY